jgi:IS605 OrfB family transposase
MPVLTTETRLSEKEAGDIMEYAWKYRADYGIIQRYVWHVIVRQKGVIDQSKLNTEIQRKFSVSKRTANSVIYDMRGRYKALKELKRTERALYKNKILHLKQQAEKIAAAVNKLKKDAAANKLDEKQLEKYRKLKKKLYYRHQRIQKFKDRLAQLKKNIANGHYSLGFGGKKTFDSQYRLEENGYRSHEGWYNDYRRKRDRNIFYLGSKDEAEGNQMFQLRPNAEGSYDIQIRMDGKYDSDVKYVYGKCRFKYLDDELRESLRNRDRPVSYRIKIRGTKIYLQAVVTLDMSKRPIVTSMVHGAIGLDFNDGHIDLAETDGKGNLVAMDRYRLKYHGTGGRAANEMRQVTAEIGKYALSKGKSIVKEYLSFARKKSQTEKGSGKRYNRMLHTLDYSRYEDDIRNMAVRNGIDLIEVNPAYTSQIAETKYCPIRKIPVHNGAAYVIARKGQGYKDKAV